MFQSLLLVDNVSYTINPIAQTSATSFQSLLLVDNVSYNGSNKHFDRKNQFQSLF